MKPKWHIFWGVVATLIIWFLTPGINLVYLVAFFLTSFIMGFSLHFSSKTKEEGKHFHLFHTVEFLFLLGILSFIWTFLFYFFIGMIFHSLLDLIYSLKKDKIYKREFFFFNWVRKRVF